MLGKEVGTKRTDSAHWDGEKEQIAMDWQEKTGTGGSRRGGRGKRRIKERIGETAKSECHLRDCMET